MIRTAIVAILLSLWVIILGPPLILYTLITRSADLMYWVGVKGVVWITFLAGLRVRVVGLENIPAGVCMFAANHASNADAAAIIVRAIPRRLAIFGRKSLFDIPIVGLAFRLAKFVPVDRGNREAALASRQAEAVEYMKTGSSFLVYPEGTRSPDGRLARFKKGVFAMAIEAGVPIVPLACSGAHRVMKKKSLIIHAGKRFAVSFGKTNRRRRIYRRPAGRLCAGVHDAIADQLPEDPRTYAAAYS